jgi:superfamily II DNA or RNA helicase
VFTDGRPLIADWSRDIATTMKPDPVLAMSDEFERIVRRHVDGLATREEEALLAGNEKLWIRALYRLLDDVAETIDDTRTTVKGHQRATIVRDLETDYEDIERVLTRLVGPAQSPIVDETAQAEEIGTVQLQLSWVPGRVIAWAGGPGVRPEGAAEIIERLREAGAGSVEWEEHRDVMLPSGGRADAVSASLESCLGWLVALGTMADDETAGASVAWMGVTAALAVRLAAQGRMVPQLRKLRRRKRGDEETKSDQSTFSVRWAPALVDAEILGALSESLPGAVAAFENQRDATAFTAAVLGDLVEAIGETAAERVEVPAPPPVARTKSDVAEAMLARLDGTSFEVPSRLGSELGRRLDQWSKSVTSAHESGLVIQLDPPDESGAWYLAVLSLDEEGKPQPVETALVTASNTRRQSVKNQLARLERLFPELLRLGGRRRGEVILSQDEAWRLMTETGSVLAANGFDVRVPALSRRRPTPALRLTSLEAEDTVVGAQQLADVRWSVVFDDVELTAEEIHRLAAQAQPLVKSRGQWVEIDRADLAEAAAALADRADKTRLTGADMLRHALGLEGSPLLGGVSIAGEGWAADLLRSASEIPEVLPTRPDGFRGELRSYQADAYTWLGFLDSAGLGGCLALDMGLGKTPTMLAHINSTTGHGPSLVVAPPAVVGNWAAEAARFTGALKVVVHHGPSRTSETGVPTMAEKADLVITTYGTAVRDMNALEKVTWSKVVLDEAQAIKNPASDTAQQLRRLDARSRVALTGTPIENGLGDLWSIMDFCNPGLLGGRAHFVAEMSQVGNGDSRGEGALAALNGILVFRRTKVDPAIAAELPDRIDELDHCTMTTEQIGLYQAVLDALVVETASEESTPKRKGAVLAAITALKQICNHPVNYEDDGEELEGRSGKLARLNEIVDQVFAVDERILIFTHFATWGERLAAYLTERTGKPIPCYHGGLGRTARDRMIHDFQSGTGAGAMVLSLKAGGTGLNLTAANHVVLYDRWWNPAVEDQARDRVWRIGQKNTVVCHRLVCPGTVDERVEEVVAGKRRIADMVLPKSSSIGDLDAEQLQVALGIDRDQLLVDDGSEVGENEEVRS